MSEPRDLPDAPGEDKATDETGAAEPKVPVAWRYRRIAIAFAGALLLILGSVASAPFWAPLLPRAPALVPASKDAASDGVDRIAPQQQENPAQTQPPQSQRESQPPVSPPPVSPPPQSRPEEAAASAALQLLDRRVGALEARPGAPASDIAELRQQLARLATTAAELDARIAALGKATLAQAATDTTDMALVLALLQIRGALDAGRPFPAEYEALAGLARARPDIAAAAAPLAEPATTGVASRTVLANRLRELSGEIARAAAPADATPDTAVDANATVPDWTDRALTRLRGLVTVRRVDGAVQRSPGGSPKAPVNAADLALAGGDLEAAVGALDRLTGASAEAAGPWLRMAKQRLAVETALYRIEALLVARLGSTPSAPSSAPGGGGSPR